MSFYRSCKKCGETISFRQMPAGQWVAFEPGTDILHKCENDKIRKSSNDRHKDRAYLQKNKESDKSYLDYDLDNWEDLPKYPPSNTWINNNLYAKDILCAISNNLRVEIVYSGGSTPMTKRVMEPKELFERAKHQYLSAYCCLRQDYRSFRFDKIISLNICAEKQSSPTAAVAEKSSFSSQPYFTNSIRKQSVTHKRLNQDMFIKTIGWVLFLLFMGYLLFN